MTYQQIQDAIIADRFRETQRSDVKNWINHRYWWLWALEDWTFKKATDAVSVTAGSAVVGSVPADFKTALHLLTWDGYTLERILNPADYQARYAGSPTVTGKPEAFTVIGSSILVGPASNETSSAYTLLYEKEYTALSADGDTPALPEGSHFALVHGGAAEGLKLQNDPTWQAFEDDFQATLTILRASYLSAIDSAGIQVPAYRP